MTLTGLALVVLYSGLRLGLNGWDSGEQRAETTNRLRQTQDFLRRLLVQSQAVYRLNDRQESIMVFTGRADYLELVAPLLTQLGQAGLYRVRIVAADGKLRIRFRPYSPNDSQTAGDDREAVLLEGAFALEWAYFGPERDDDPRPPRWRSEWSSTDRRPALVRLNLTVAGESWPDLVVALAEGPRR